VSTAALRLALTVLTTTLVGACSFTTTEAGIAAPVGGPRAALGPALLTPPVTAPGATGEVFIEGDSLTVGMAPYLPDLLSSAGWAVTLDGQVGRDTATGIGILAQRAPEIRGTLVVALGTNDPPDVRLFSDRIDEVMQVAAGHRVIWVSIARNGWDDLDAALLAARSAWPNLQVLDWRPVIAAHPDMLAGDGIHLTQAGYQLRSQVVAAAIESSS
jgi:lysophospholipase L1-like esterase